MQMCFRLSVVAFLSCLFFGRDKRQPEIRLRSLAIADLELAKQVFTVSS